MRRSVRRRFSVRLDTSFIQQVVQLEEVIRKYRENSVGEDEICRYFAKQKGLNLVEYLNSGNRIDCWNYKALTLGQARKRLQGPYPGPGARSKSVQDVDGYDVLCRSSCYRVRTSLVLWIVVCVLLVGGKE